MPLSGHGELQISCAIALGEIVEPLRFTEGTTQPSDDTAIEIVYEPMPGSLPVSTWRGAGSGRAAETGINTGAEARDPDDCWGTAHTYTTILRTLTPLVG